MRVTDIITDLIFPKRCPVCHDIVKDRGYLICADCIKQLTYVNDPYCIKCGKPFRNTEAVLCRGCSMRDNYFAQNRSVFVYDDMMRMSIYRFKYGGRAEYAAFYAQEIVRCLNFKISEWNPEVIIPIPLHRSKIKKRGYNQAYLIARQISLLTKIPVDDSVLLRAKETEKQKNLGASERSHNLKNAFKMRQNGVKYYSAMLIDDIYTTGATMNSAAKALKDGGTELVYCITLSIGYDV